MVFLRRLYAYLRLALSALGTGHTPLREGDAETQPEGYDVRGPIKLHKRRVEMDPPGALVQTRSVPMSEYEGPLKWAELRRQGIDPNGER